MSEAIMVGALCGIWASNFFMLNHVEKIRELLEKKMTTFDEMGVEFQEALKEAIIEIDSLGKNSLQRLLKKTLAHPLEDNIVKLNLRNEGEVNTYNRALDIQSIKFSMMVESLKADAEEQRIQEARENRLPTKNRIPDNIDLPDYAKENE